MLFYKSRAVHIRNTPPTVLKGVSSLLNTEKILPDASSSMLCSWSIWPITLSLRSADNKFIEWISALILCTTDDGTRWNDSNFVKNRAAFLVCQDCAIESAASEDASSTAVQSSTLLGAAKTSHCATRRLRHKLLPWQRLTWEVKDFRFENTFLQIKKQHAVTTPEKMCF